MMSLQHVGRRISRVSSLRFLSTAARPYMLQSQNFALSSGESERVVEINLMDPCKLETVKIRNQTVPKDLSPYMYVPVGSSKGWVALTNIYDPKFHLTNLFNPCSTRKVVISLPPPLKIDRGSIAHVALSSSPEEEGCVVAARLTAFPYASFIGLCRPGDSEWTYIEIPNSLYLSKVIYSAKDRRFYLPSLSSGPNDLIKTCSDFPLVSPYPTLPFSDTPKSTQDFIHSCIHKTQYLVEAPSGDSFIVFWCMDLMPDQNKIRPTFMVFRQDIERGIASYTQDIGDLCIFLGTNEAFCVSATQYPGLNPNSVYFEGFDEIGFGFYDLSSNTLHPLTHLFPNPSGNYNLWLAPLH